MQRILGKKNERGTIVKLTSIAVLLGVALILCSPNMSISAEQWRFKFATFEPAHSLFHKSFWFWWCDRVEELSKGRVKFDKFPAQTLVKAPECYEAVRDGITQAGIFTIPYEAGLVTLPTIKELPFSYVSHDIHHLMWLKFMKVGLQDYFHTYGVHIVADMTLSPYGFWTSKKWGPIKKLEDLKGCKIRSPGGYMSEACKAMGGVPVAMPSPEAYTAMERGTLDCLTMPESSNIAFRLHEVTGYISRPNYGMTGVPICVNLKVWNSLPEDIQYIMLQAGEEAYDNHARAMEKFQVDVVEPTVKKAGIEVVDLPKSEIERMRKACAPVWDKWLAKNGDVFNGLGRRMFEIVVRQVGRP